MFKSILLVGIGGFFGSIGRYLITRFEAVNSQSIFPYGTFAVNIIGSFLIGIVIAASLGDDITPNTRLLIATGFCGGFTTFSSFSYEFFSLLQSQHTGHAFLYAGASLILGLVFVWLGFSLFRP